MKYETYPPHPDLSSIVQCYWTLEVPSNYSQEKQRIIPDGSIEMAFLLGDDIQRFTSDHDYIIQPRSMVIGQITEPFFIFPTGFVDTFAIRFFPFSFANLVSIDIKNLANKETPLDQVFHADQAHDLRRKIVDASDTQERIAYIETFIFDKLKNENTIDKIVISTVDALMASKGSKQVHEILGENISQRRKLERKFSKQIGMSPKQLGKVIRLQTALKLMLNGSPESLTNVAYQSDYYDQAHFIKDFKEFTGANPNAFLEDQNLELSKLFYSE